MSLPIENAIRAALQRLERWALRDEEDGDFVAPVAVSESAIVLVVIHADEDAQEVLLRADLCVVPPARRAAVALHLAQLNAQWKYVVFSMRDGSVAADISVDLTFVSNSEAAIALSFLRLVRPIRKEYAGTLVLAQKRSRSIAKVEREARAIVNRLGD